MRVQVVQVSENASVAILNDNLEDLNISYALNVFDISSRTMQKLVGLLRVSCVGIRMCQAKRMCGYKLYQGPQRRLSLWYATTCFLYINPAKPWGRFRLALHNARTMMEWRMLTSQTHQHGSALVVVRRRLLSWQWLRTAPALAMTIYISQVKLRTHITCWSVHRSCYSHGHTDGTLFIFYLTWLIQTRANVRVQLQTLKTLCPGRAGVYARSQLDQHDWLLPDKTASLGAARDSHARDLHWWHSGLITHSCAYVSFVYLFCEELRSYQLT